MSISASAYDTMLSTSRENLLTSEAVDQVTLQKPALELIRQAIKNGFGESLHANLSTSIDNSTVLTDASGTYTSAVSGEIIKRAKFEWSEPIVSHYRVPYGDLKRNAGKAQIEDLLKAQMKSTIEGHAVYLDGALHAATTAAGDVTSLYTIVSNTAVLGGINPATNPFWKATCLTLEGAWTPRQAYSKVANTVQLANGQPATDVLACIEHFEAWQDYFEAKGQIQQLGGDKAIAGFRELYFGTLRIVLDPSAVSNTSLFINRKSLIAEYLDGEFMRVQDPRQVPGTLDYDHPMATIMQLGTTARRDHAKLTWDPTDTGAQVVTVDS